MKTRPKYKVDQIVQTMRRLPHAITGEHLPGPYIPARSRITILEIRRNADGYRYRIQPVNGGLELWADEDALIEPLGEEYDEN